MNFTIIVVVGCGSNPATRKLLFVASSERNFLLALSPSSLIPQKFRLEKSPKTPKPVEGSNLRRLFEKKSF